MHMSSLLKSAPVRIAGKFVFILFTLVFAIWASFAMWFQLPFGDAMRGSVIAIWLLIALAVIAGERHYSCWRRRLFFCLLALAMLAAWSTVRPSLNRIWAPDVARTVTGHVNGDLVTLSNVRDFIWRTTEDFTPNWKEETYDLSKITSVDVFLSYWSSPAIAHTLLSFGFEDGRHVVFSGEIRREHHEVFSAIAGFFRQFELAMIAAEERDIIYLRTNVRKENVYRYRVKLPPAGARELFLSYVTLGNQLAEQPKFYNTLTANCTTIIFHMARVLDPNFPFDYRILLSGFLPGYLYDHGWLENGGTLEELRQRASIDARALAGGRDGFSERIRE
ncbi:DUF4105 domain-containing protein [Brucella intermedia]|uniref:Lnb N-terminal periplasmic domain-containing protein n=1 Tax=Brucella intermedia TaxID=94625 RepID=UPI00124D9D70|nr:DUF4105 domain-containing protein [Brucella intermedia]KAB2668917.1 DUF4105 domain-containing protein [Ochrobactrum sp. LMG 5442]KAB2715403.1 DUF4105 domain-containing protein [Brucella intermedia]